jgi:16S rRNA (guanine527-N7)-methyltransferase
MDKKENILNCLNSAPFKPFVQADILAEKLAFYADEIVSWNEKFNLTSIKDEREIIIKHFIDSLFILTLDIFQGEPRIADIGTGAGLPGIPIALAVPQAKVTLIDSNGKKLEFLNNVKQKLKLDNLSIVQDRAEILSQKQPFREKYNIAVTRALSDYAIAREVCCGLVKLSGVFVYYASARQADILSTAKFNQNRKLGLEKEEVTRYTLPEEMGERAFVVVKKVWKTFDGYPRHYNKIKAKPLA